LKEESYYECITRVPIDTDLDNVMLPITIKEKELTDAKILDLENKNIAMSAKYIGIFILMFTFIAVLATAFWFFNFVYPRVIYIKAKK